MAANKTFTEEGGLLGLIVVNIVRQEHRVIFAPAQVQPLVEGSAARGTRRRVLFFFDRARATTRLLTVWFFTLSFGIWLIIVRGDH